MIISIGLLTYCIMGFSLMYPGVNEGGFFGFAGFGLSMPEGDAGGIAYADGGYTYWTDFIFQAMFEATAATVVSGAVAERIKLNAFLIFATLFAAISYSVTGMWKRGNQQPTTGKFSKTTFSEYSKQYNNHGKIQTRVHLVRRLQAYAEPA